MSHRNRKLDPRNGIPLYLQLKEYIENEISSGLLLPGKQVPSEHEMVKRLGICRATVRQAYQKLVDSGMLIKIRGRGTFVVQNKGTPETKFGQYPKLLAFLMRDAAGGIQPGLIKSVTSTASKFGYSTIVSNSGNSLERALETVNHFADQKVDGVLFRPLAMNPFEEVNIRICEEIQRRNIPFVFVDIPVKDVGVSSICSDNIQGGQMIGNYLYSKGHRDVMVVTHCINPNTENRITGLKMQCGMHVDILMYYQEIDGDFERKIQRLFQSSERPSTIFAIHDLVAHRLLEYLGKQYIHIPEDVSLVGFDNLDFSAWLTPPLTTVNQDLEQMGSMAVKELIRLIQEPFKQPKEIRIPVSFIERESVRELVPIMLNS